jgi:uncharacterized membrane protein YdbT with pleckstrin-like domain
MKYVDKVLQPGERVEYRARVHWIAYLPAIVILIAALAVGGLIAATAASDWALAAPLLLLVIAVVLAISAWIRRATTALAVTDRRVIVKLGFIRRTTMEMNRSKIESVLVEQGISGRLFDYGTIIVKGTGGGFEPVEGIDQPLAFRSTITAG